MLTGTAASNKTLSKEFMVDENDRMIVLRNESGMSVTLSERGAAMISWAAPDRYGRMGDVLLGCREAQDYMHNDYYFGAIVGRWANRIEQGKFLVDGKPFQVDVNDRGNHLHGGPGGFHTRRWESHTANNSVSFRLSSADGEGGFPGNVEVQVDYRLDDDGSLSIDYHATTDAPTPFNLTSHPYFNLNGSVSDVGDHLLQIDADYYFEIDSTGIPVSMASVGGTPFDFRRPAAIGSRLKWPDAQLTLAGGFDHCYCLSGHTIGRPAPLREVARVYEPSSGRVLQVSTTEVGLQFYSGNFLAGVQGRSDQPYAKHDGFCLEPGAYPNQINGELAQSVILRPEEVYRQTTTYRIWVET